MKKKQSICPNCGSAMPSLTEVVREAAAAGLSAREVAERVGCTVANIYRVARKIDVTFSRRRRKPRSRTSLPRYRRAYERFQEMHGRPPSQAELAQDMGVTRERVRQIAAALDLPWANGKRLAANARSLEVSDRVVKAMRTLKAEGAPLYRSDIARAAGVAPATVTNICRRFGITPPYGSGGRPLNRAALDRVAAAHAELTTTLGRHPTMSELGRHIGLTAPEVQHYALRFPLSRAAGRYGKIVHVSRPEAAA